MAAPGPAGWGYALAGVLVLALGAYAFWPAGPAATAQGLCANGVGPDFTLRANGQEQRITGLTVLTGGWTLAQDADRIRRLDQAVKALTALPGAPIEGVDEGRAPAYGIDGSRALDGTRRLRWGRADGRCYVLDADTKRLSPVATEQVDALDAACVRLDSGKLLALPEAPAQVEADSLVLANEGGAWVPVFARNRPALTSRIAALLRLAAELPLDDLDNRALPLLPVAMRLRVASAPGPTHGSAELRIHALPGAAEAWAAADGRPAQRLSGPTLAAWRAAWAALQRDHLIDQPVGYDCPFASLSVSVGGVERFSMVRRGGNDELEGRSTWEVVWPLGREPAAADAAKRLLQACNRLAVTAPHPVEAGAPPLTGALTIAFAKGPTLELAGQEARANGFAGTVAFVPELLRELKPEAMLERRLTLRTPDRVVKVQRRWLSGGAPRAEVVLKGDAGAWRRSHAEPAGSTSGSIDALAVARLARALCQAEGGEVRFAGAEGRDVVAAPDFELAVRFAARDDRKAANDDTVDLEETAATDAGWAFRRRDASWLAVDLTGGLAWTVGDELMETLMAPIDRQVLVPVVPALVNVIVGRSPAGVWRLARGEPWVIADAADSANLTAASGWGPSRPADSVAVRRLLRRVTAIAAIRSDPGAARLQGDEIAAAISFELPAIGQGPAERLTLYLGRAVSGEVACTTESDRPDAPVPAGRWYLPAVEAAELQLPAGAFAVAP